MSNILTERLMRSAPKDVQEKLIEIVDKMKVDSREMGAFKGHHLEFVFAVYNRYLTGSRKEDINCKGCVAKVWGKVQMIVDGLKDCI